MPIDTMPIGTLALHAQRGGKVFATATTWWNKIRQRGWKRPTKRLCPAKPKFGIRSTKPNEIWHADATVIRLLDGTTLFLHTMVDNFSRRVLAWRLCAKLDPTTTVMILRKAAANLAIASTLVTDRGVENVNCEVDSLVNDGVNNRVLALVEAVQTRLLSLIGAL